MNREVFEKENKNACGRNIKMIRKMVLCISQERLAKMLDEYGGKKYTAKEISLIERGKAKISDIEVKLFADIFGVSISTLFSEDEN